MVDIDWCARLTKLRAVEEAILTGEMVTEARFGADMVVYANAKLVDVQRAIETAERNCALQTPGRRRRRYALPGRARPY